MATSKQARDYLLCGVCERRFNKFGEQWTLAHIANNKGFLLQETLARQAATALSEDIFLFENAVGVDHNKLGYFALSIVWRAAVHNWSIEGRTFKRLTLGPFEEPLRQFLLGERELGKNFAVQVIVSSAANYGRFLTPPETSRVAKDICHYFELCGIRFHVYVGRELSQNCLVTCCIGSPTRPIFYSAIWERNADRHFSELLHRKHHAR